MIKGIYNLRSQTVSKTEYLTPVKHKYTLRSKRSAFVEQLKETEHHKFFTPVKHTYNLRSIRQVCKVLF